MHTSINNIPKVPLPVIRYNAFPLGCQPLYGPPGPCRLTKAACLDAVVDESDDLEAIAPGPALGPTDVRLVPATTILKSGECPVGTEGAFAVGTFRIIGPNVGPFSLVYLSAFLWYSQVHDLITVRERSRCQVTW